MTGLPAYGLLFLKHLSVYCTATGCRQADALCLRRWKFGLAEEQQLLAMPSSEEKLREVLFSRMTDGEQRQNSHYDQIVWGRGTKESQPLSEVARPSESC